MKRWAWVVLLWGCPSDPKTEQDPEQDQGVVDAGLDADVGVDLDAEVEGATLRLEGRGPCGLTLGVPRPGEVATGEYLAVEITVRGSDPAAADGRIAAGTEVVFRQGDETADSAQVVAFVSVFDEALAEGTSLAEAVQAAAVGRARVVEGQAVDRVFCVGVGSIELTAELTDYQGQGPVVIPEGQRLTVECVPGAVYREQCAGGDAGAPDAETDFDARVDERDAQPTDGPLPDRGPPVDALVLNPEAGPPDAEPELDAGAPDMADPNAPPVPLRCAPVRPAGGECDGDDRACEPGLTCISGRCAPPSPADGDCETANDCQANLYCRAYSQNGEALAIGICSARGVVGEACHRRNFGCEFGLTCLFDVCAELSTFDGPCLTTGDCDRNTWCDRPQGVEVGTCRGFELEGAACDPLNNGCGPNLACLNGICGFRQPMGGGCGQAADCQPSQYCDRLDENGNPRVEPICLDRREVGDACEAREGSVCRQSRCIQGVCATDQPIGAPCDSTFDCAAGGFCPQP